MFPCHEPLSDSIAVFLFRLAVVRVCRGIALLPAAHRPARCPPLEPGRSGMGCCRHADCFQDRASASAFLFSGQCNRFQREYRTESSLVGHGPGRPELPGSSSSGSFLLPHLSGPALCDRMVCAGRMAQRRQDRVCVDRDGGVVPSGGALLFSYFRQACTRTRPLLCVSLSDRGRAVGEQGGRSPRRARCECL